MYYDALLCESLKTCCFDLHIDIWYLGLGVAVLVLVLRVDVLVLVLVLKIVFLVFAEHVSNWNVDTKVGTDDYITTQIESEMKELFHAAKELKHQS